LANTPFTHPIPGPVGIMRTIPLSMTIDDSHMMWIADDNTNDVLKIRFDDSIEGDSPPIVNCPDIGNACVFNSNELLKE
jgi:hypothetical protein